MTLPPTDVEDVELPGEPEPGGEGRRPGIIRRITADILRRLAARNRRRARR